MSLPTARFRGPPPLSEKDREFARVQQFLDGKTTPRDAVLEATLRHCKEQGLPPIAVSQSQGVMMGILTKSMNAKRVLEIGTLGGYSAIFFGRNLAPGGFVDSIEIDPHHAKVAESNMASAGLSQVVRVHVGPAYDLLRDPVGPFVSKPDGIGYDLAFIDANKEQSKEYFIEAQRLLRPGGLIIVDNVARNGSVAPRADETPSSHAIGIRRLLDHIEEDGGRTIRSSVVQTVSDKGWDGYLLAYIG